MYREKSLEMIQYGERKYTHKQTPPQGLQNKPTNKQFNPDESGVVRRE